MTKEKPTNQKTILGNNAILGDTPILGDNPTKPYIIKQYSGKGKPGEQDIFLFFRPKTNGYKIESVILNAFRNSPMYPASVWLEYMANLPGLFLSQDNVMHKYYEHKYYFARKGKQAFTPSMRRKFENRFHKNFQESCVLGAYEALRYLKAKEGTLSLKCPCTDTGTSRYIEGQRVSMFRTKENKEVFVVNGDIPALMKQHYDGTNCAVLLFRTTLSYEELKPLIRTAIESLYKEKKNIAGEMEGDDETHEYFDLSDEAFFRGAYKRFFSYSNGPFEQLHDAMNFLYDAHGQHIDLGELSFSNYLLERGVSSRSLATMLRYPVGHFDVNNSWEEHSLFSLTYQMGYENAYEVYRSMRSQLMTSLSREESPVS